MRTVDIYQPYLPSYRLQFFNTLAERLAERALKLRVIASSPAGAQRLRGDRADADWAVDVSPRVVGLLGHDATYWNAMSTSRNAAAVVLPLQATVLDTFPLILRSRNARRLGLWGHVAPFVKPANPLDRWLETRMMRRAGHIFAYTPAGARDAIDRGVSPTRVSAVMNTVETASYHEEPRPEVESAMANLQRALNLQPAKTIAFIGALDSSKRVNFLSGALETLWSLDPSIKLLVLGAGPDAPLLEPSAARGQSILMGHDSGVLKETVLRSCDAIVCPGRIGLLAVDALAARRPILTTNFPWHAPEVDYLELSVSRHDLPNDPVGFATDLAELLPRLPLLPETHVPQVGEMADVFANGVFAIVDREDV